MFPVAIIFSHPNSPLLDLTLPQANNESCKERKGEMSGVREDIDVCTEEPVCICGGPGTLSERKKRRKIPKSIGKALDKDTPATNTHIYTHIRERGGGEGQHLPH